MKATLQKTNLAFFTYIGIAIILTQIPFVGNYISMINTMVHESGHAFVALLGGEVHEIALFMNTEGVAMTSHSSWFGGFFTSIAGYVFSSFFAFLAFWLIAKRKNNVLIFILLGFIAMNLLFWVRNVYGIIWLITFAAGFVFLLYKYRSTVVKNGLLLVASILLVESILTAFYVLTLSFTQPGSAGDATNLAQTTVFIPVQVWGVFFLTQAIWFSIMSLRLGHYKV